jgi:hypothetical protein
MGIEVSSSYLRTLSTNEIREPMEIQTEGPVPINLMGTSDVLRSEAISAFNGVREAILSSGQKRELLFSDTDWNNPNYDNYVIEAINRQRLNNTGEFGKQIDAYEIGRILLENRDIYRPELPILVVNVDLNLIDDRGKCKNFILGVTDNQNRFAIQSLTRIADGTKPGDLRNAVIRRALRQAAGRLLGLPGKERINALEEGYCVNICTMRKANSVDDLKRYAMQESAQRDYFCGDCRKDFDILRCENNSLVSLSREGMINEEYRSFPSSNNGDYMLK